MRLRTRSLSFALITGAITLLLLLAYLGGALDIPQNQILDRYFVKQETPPNYLIVAVDDQSIRAVGAWPWPRETFADLVRNLQGARVIGIDVSFSEPSSRGSADDEALRRALQDSQTRIILPLQIEDKSGLLLSPLPFLEAYADLGVTNISVDADGIVRATPLTKGGVPVFGSTLVSHSATRETVRVRYAGGAGTITTVPTLDILDGSYPAHLIEGRVVLIGATAPDLQDFVQTPFGRIPGVEYHANVAVTLENGAFFKELGRAADIILIIGVNLIAALLVYRMRSFAMLFFSLGAVVLLLGLGSVILFGLFVIIPILYALAGFIVTSGLLILFQYVTESKEKQFIRKTFQYYLAPDVIEEISRDPKKLTLGGEKKKVTILFSDIRGFTTISEALTPEALMAKLNVYLTEMTDVIMERRGLVDKYIGDAIMAFWGAPLYNDMQARDACDAAIEMIRRLDALNKKWNAEGELPFQIGIGLSTGDVVVGNMGSTQRFNYTIIGDEVNFAARLEGLTKAYGVTCLIGENTKNELANDIRFKIRELDLVMVKGKHEPKRIYELMTNEIDDVKANILSHFEEGRKCYMKGQWSDAISSFEDALGIGEDGPSQTFLERSRMLSQNPPHEWNGVYEFKTK